MPPFTDEEVVAAFPEFHVTVPEIGRGNQKVVYRATADAEIALKIMLWDIATAGVDDDNDEEVDEAVERFHREIHGMTSVNCPHVIRVAHGPGTREIGNSSHYWYTEPFLVGGTLKDRLRSGPLPATDVERIANALLTAVQAMWNEGRFVHRDIKPGNIGFLANGEVVLIDLGIALFTEMNPITGSSVAGPGTWQYAAPEQFDIKRLSNMDFRTDQFQIGIVLFEALFGVRPFNGYGAAYAANLRSFDSSLLDDHRVTPGLRRLIPRLLAGSPSERYRRIDAALEDLNGGI